MTVRRETLAVTIMIMVVTGFVHLSSPAIAADDPAYDTTAERKQLYIDRVYDAGYPYGEYDSGRKVGGYAAMAQFAKGNITEGRNFVDYHLDRNRDMFWGINVMEAFKMYGDSYTQALRDKVKSRILSFEILKPDGTGLLGSTSNHYLMYAAVGVTAGETWEEYPSNRYDVSKQYLLNTLPSMAKRGHWEYDATTYLIHYVIPLLYLAENTQDPELRDMSRMTLEWLFAATVGEYLKGSLVTTSGRTYNPMQGPGFNTQDSIQLLWLLFGGSRLPEQWNGSAIIPWSYMPVALSNYELPDIFRRIALDRDSTYTHRERMNMPNNPYKTSYITPNYAVYGQRDSKASMYADTGPRWGVKWVTESNVDEPSAFFMKHIYPGRGTPGQPGYVPPNDDPTTNSYWLGLDRSEEVLQDSGTLIAVYNITDTNTFIDGPVSRNGMKATLERDGWVHFHTGTLLLGVKPINGYTWPTGTEDWFYDDYVQVLRSDGAKNGLIIETASPTDYAGTMTQQLTAFANDIRDSTSIDATGINNTNPRLKYTNIHGRTLEIVYGTSRKIQNIEVNYANWPLLDNPWIHQDYDSTTLTLIHSGETRAYNFANWTNTGTIFTDNFEDGDAVGWTTSGWGSWSVVNDGTYVYRQSSLERSYSSSGQGSWTDYTYDVDVTPLTFGAPTPNPTVGIMARYTDTNNRYGFMYTGGNMVINKIVNGVPQTLATKPFTFTPGTTYAFRASLDGSSLKFYINGVQQLSASDNSISAGKIALATNNATAQFDEIAVTSP